MLILADHKPSIWDIGWTEDTEIIGVFATGYHRQAVAGLPKETPIKSVLSKTKMNVVI